MATESPIRFMEASGRRWSSHKEASELGLLPKDQRFQGNARNTVPNRSESAPPSIEGSFAAIENFMSLQKFGVNASLADRKSESEQFRADPAYLAYHSSNFDLKPRLSPPLISSENQRLVSSVGSLGNSWRSKSLDDSKTEFLDLSECKLATHEEESEEDRSPQRARDDGLERKSGYWSEQDTALLGQHKLLVDLLQERNPRSSSPIHNKLRSFGHDPVEDAVDEADSSSFHNHSVNTSNSILSGAYDINEGLPAKPPLYRRRSNTLSGHLAVDVPSNGVPEPGITHVESEMKTISITSLPNSENQKNGRDQLYSHQNNMVPQQLLLHQRHSFEVPGAKSQMISQGINDLTIGMNQFQHGLPNFSSAAYMNSLNPFYHNMHPSGYFSQFGIGGYAVNTTSLSPFIPGYPQNAIPMAYDSRVGPSFMAQTSGFSTVGMQHTNKFYGHHGYSLKPSFIDPLNTHHFPQTSEDAYNHGIGGSSNLNPRMVGPTSPYHLGNQTNTGILMHFPTSPISTPVLPAPTLVGPRFPGGKNEQRLQPGYSGNAGVYFGWQGQRAPGSVVDTKPNSFLEEVRSGKGRRFELVDIAGRIVEYSADQHGSRFIQQKLENCSVDEKASVFKEVIPLASNLMTDVFGNYVIQKFFDYGSFEQRKELADKLKGQILPLSLQMYGCRVIQKALEVIELEQKIKLIYELDGHVTRCVRDQNGNHVIQKCIESIPTDKIGFIISAFRGQVATLSTHPYGCRVIQRVLEHCTDELQSEFIVDEILESTYSLAQDQYGNYVTQHVLGRGKPQERSRIINKLSGHVVQMSQHKFASNVVEKCLVHGDSSSREILIGEIIGHNEENDNLLIMMKDQYANYVVQKILETCTDNQREMLLSRISIHLNALKKYTYGKHIAARFEQLFGEEIQRFEA